MSSAAEENAISSKERTTPQLPAYGSFDASEWPQPHSRHTVRHYNGTDTQDGDGQGADDRQALQEEEAHRQEKARRVNTTAARTRSAASARAALSPLLDDNADEGEEGQ
ncbi:hypothetical protein F443_19707, partial [Phytophthora nicotianae P1569]